MAQITFNSKDFLSDLYNYSIEVAYNNIVNDKHTSRIKSFFSKVYVAVLVNALGKTSANGWSNAGIATETLKNSIKGLSQKTKVENKTKRSFTAVFTTKASILDNREANNYGYIIGSDNSSDYGLGDSDIHSKLTEWIKQKKSKGNTFNFDVKLDSRDKTEDEAIARRIMWSWRRKRATGTEGNSRLVLPFWYDLETTKNEYNRKELIKIINERTSELTNVLGDTLR